MSAIGLVGAGLGLWYAFLRPLRRRRTGFADVLFLLGAAWAWVYHSFAVCRGDLRLGYSAGLLLGAVLLNGSLGRLLEPVFDFLWRILGKILETALFPGRIFLGFAKKTVASAGKWGKINQLIYKYSGG